MASTLTREAASTPAAEVSLASRLSPRLQALLLTATLLGAAALRWLHLSMVPQFTDESLEVLWSLPIARGERFPLTNYDTYYGAVFNYLVAVSFTLLGPGALAARVVVLVTGVFTVLATYGLGRAWGGPLAGLIAAALLASNAAHIVINSHVAWSNCTTPLFTTLAVWALWSAVSRGPAAATSGGLLALSGLLWGLALQTHPLVATMLPGAAAYVFWKGRAFLPTPWPYLAAGTFLIGYGNVLVYNLINGPESLLSAARIRQDYAADQDAAASYPAALASELMLLARALAGAVDSRPAPWGYILDLPVVLGVALAVVGLWQQRRFDNPLPLLLVVSCLVLLPIVNPKFQTLISSRYVMPLVPILLASSAAFLASWLVARGLPRTSSRTLSRSGVMALGVAILMLLAPIPPLARYYDRAYATADTNERVYALARLVSQNLRPGELLVLDEGFGSETGQGVSELRALRYLLSFQDTPVRVLKLTPKRLEDELEHVPGLLVVLSGRHVREYDRLPLQPLTEPPRRGTDVGVYRLGVGVRD